MEYTSTVGSLRVTRLEQVAHRFGSDKLYICLSNKCFKVYPVYSLCTDVRPSQDHRILRMQIVRINLATDFYFIMNKYIQGQGQVGFSGQLMAWGQVEQVFGGSCMVMCIALWVIFAWQCLVNRQKDRHD